MADRFHPRVIHDVGHGYAVLCADHGSRLVETANLPPNLRVPVVHLQHYPTSRGVRDAQVPPSQPLPNINAAQPMMPPPQGAQSAQSAPVPLQQNAMSFGAAPTPAMSQNHLPPRAAAPVSNHQNAVSFAATPVSVSHHNHLPPQATAQAASQDPQSANALLAALPGPDLSGFTNPGRYRTLTASNLSHHAATPAGNLTQSDRIIREHAVGLGADLGADQTEIVAAAGEKRKERTALMLEGDVENRPSKKLKSTQADPVGSQPANGHSGSVNGQTLPPDTSGNEDFSFSEDYDFALDPVGGQPANGQSGSVNGQTLPPDTSGNQDFSFLEDYDFPLDPELFGTTPALTSDVASPDPSSDVWTPQDCDMSEPFGMPAQPNESGLMSAVDAESLEKELEAGADEALRRWRESLQ